MPDNELFSSLKRIIVFIIPVVVLIFKLNIHIKWLYNILKIVFSWLFFFFFKSGSETERLAFFLLSLIILNLPTPPWIETMVCHWQILVKKKSHCIISDSGSFPLLRLFFFKYFKNFCGLPDILCRTVETEVRGIYAWKCACPFCHSLESIQSVDLGFGFIVAMVTIGFIFLYCHFVLWVGAGLWKVSLQCSRSWSVFCLAVFGGE